MKRPSLSQLLLLLVLPITASAQTEAVKKVPGTNAITEDLAFGAGRTLTLSGAFAGIPTGGTLDLGNLTLTLPTSSLQIGTSVQAYSAVLGTWSGIVPGEGVGAWLADPTASKLRTAVAGDTGTGNLVFHDSPTLVTPNIGAAAATSINGLGITASTGTLTIANGKTASVSNTLTFTGTDGSTLNIGTGGTLAAMAYLGTATSAETITGTATNLGVTPSGVAAHVAARNSLVGQMAPKCWYDATDLVGAEGSTVTSWPDRSGNGWTLTPAAGTQYLRTGGINGMPAMESSNGSMQSVAGMFSGSPAGITIFHVGKWESSAITGYNAPILALGEVQSGIFWAEGPNRKSSQMGANLWTNAGALTTGNVSKHRLPLYRERVAAYRFAAGTTADIWVDGAMTYDAAAVSGPVTGRMYVGSYWTTETHVHRTGEVIVFDRALSDAEMHKVNAYLLQKWGLDRLPRLVMIGDSIAESLNATANDGLMDNLGDLYSGWQMFTPAHSGTSLDQYVNTIARTKHIINMLRHGDICMVWAGGIDIGLGGAATTVQANMTTLIGRIHARGAKAVLVTMIPRYNSPDGPTQAATEAQRLLLNAWITAGTTADAYIDPCTETAFDDISDISNATYYDDAPNGLHPNSAGYTAALPAFTSVLDTLLK